MVKISLDEIALNILIECVKRKHDGVDGTLDVTLPKVLTNSEKEYIVEKVRRWHERQT
tara:strand:- start:264 stop:437 length:174 start_codon:yes stop_codon:yes gene_type:complete